MGVLNATPDSFSDGGNLATTGEAVSHGLRMVAEGAAIVDVGGESTRPGAERVSAGEELSRVLPVVSGLVGAGVHVSIDTMRATVARAAVAAGAHTVNDVSGGMADAAMLDTVAGLNVDYVLMHWRTQSRTMQAAATYDDVVEEVITELCGRRDAAVNAGIDPSRIILDPGIGFSKTAEHNWALLRSLSRFTALGHRVLVGASRKRFLGELLDGRRADGRDAATAAISAWCASHGVWGVRTHEVSLQADAIAVGSHMPVRAVVEDPRNH